MNFSHRGANIEDMVQQCLGMLQGQVNLPFRTRDLIIDRLQPGWLDSILINRCSRSIKHVEGVYSSCYGSRQTIWN
jgi:hypothetical protein